MISVLNGNSMNPTSINMLVENKYKESCTTAGRQYYTVKTIKNDMTNDVAYRIKNRIDNLRNDSQRNQLPW